jgi:hypothetical protein
MFHKNSSKCGKCGIGMYNSKMESNFARIAGIGIICKNCGSDIQPEWLENPEQRVQKALEQQAKNIADAEKMAKSNKERLSEKE